jgi:hypothetical protein
MKVVLNKSFLIGSSFSLVLLMGACKKDTIEPEAETPVPSGPSYSIPTTYNFTGVDYTTSTQRIAMLGELTNYIKTSHTTTQTPQPILNAQKLKDMFVNAASQFTTTGLNASGIQLKDQTSNVYNLQTILESSYDDAATTSTFSAATPTTQSALSGTAGKLISPSRAILVDANGLEYKEQTEKGLMGAVFYYQATTILTNIGTYDNTTLIGGTTAQEKAWDEAFGYFGVPVDFPTNLTGLKYWGSYCNSVNTAIGSNATMMNAWLKGRAAITNKDNAARDAARTTVINTWERFAAAKCIAYMKGAKSNFAQDADRHHNLSEGVGFINAFAYNPSKTITAVQISQLQGYLATNLYNVTTADMDNVINALATIFNLDPNTL